MSAKPGSMPIPRFALSLDYSDLRWCQNGLRQAQNREITLFEEEFAAFLGLRKAIYVASARSGMYQVLQALNLPPKSIIIMPAWTHPSMPAMVVAAGHRPRLIDVTPGTWTMGLDNLQESDWHGAAAIVITHMFGCPAKALELAAEARRRNLVVLEDCAQGLGAMVGDRPAGSIGDASFFSFAMTKNFTTLSGGMIGLQDPDLAEKVSENYQHAVITDNNSITPLLVKALAMKTATTKLGYALSVFPALTIGYTFTGQDILHPMFEEQFTTAPSLDLYKPAPIQAALGRRMLKLITAHNKRRSENGAKLVEILRKKDLPNLEIPLLPDYGRSVFMSFVVNVPERARIARKLFEKFRIDTSPGYLKPVNQVAVLSDMVICDHSLANAEHLMKTQLHLPIYPDLSSADLQYIADALKRILCANPGAKTKAHSDESYRAHRHKSEAELKAEAQEAASPLQYKHTMEIKEDETYESLPGLSSEAEVKPLAVHNFGPAPAFSRQLRHPNSLKSPSEGLHSSDSTNGQEQQQ